MSVKYSITEMRNPLKPDEAKKFYAKSQIREKVTLDRIADEIAFASSLTDGDVLNVLRNLIRKIKEHLSDGDMVCLGDFGSFQYQLHSRGASTIEEFNSSRIHKVSLQFRPGDMIREVSQNLSFERVPSVKAQKEAAKKSLSADIPDVEA